MKYALGRIVRGLGSSTSHARTGFFAALVGLLSVNTEITCEEVFEQVEKHLHKTGSNSKRVSRHILFKNIVKMCFLVGKCRYLFRTNFGMWCDH